MPLFKEPPKLAGLRANFVGTRNEQIGLLATEHLITRQAEMTVVRNEYEQGENDPNNALDKEVTAAAYLAHPYHHSTIGWRSDIEKVPTEKLREFYDTFCRCSRIKGHGPYSHSGGAARYVPAPGQSQSPAT